MNALEAQFQQWVDRRACGSCTACCFIFEVPATTAAYAWCPHCEIGVGCRIYDERPPQCRGFYCLWRMGFGTDEDRPDRHGAVMDLQFEDGTAVLRVWRPRQVQQRKLASAVRMSRQAGDWLTADGYAVRLELHGPAKEGRHASGE